MSKASRKAVILLSGGLDSATVAAIARDDGFELYALTVAYGQRHQLELDAAARVAETMGIARHVVQPVDLRAIGGSALTADIDVPKSANVASISEGIPITYVPARNTIFLSLALAFAEAIDSTDIFIGVNAVDYSGYPDCRPAFISAFERLANLATKAGAEGNSFTIHSPLIERSKSEIIQIGLRLGVDYGLTHSCYDPTPERLACGRCDSCLLRKKGFADAGVVDPVGYVT